MGYILNVSLVSASQYLEFSLHSVDYDKQVATMLIFFYTG